METSYLIQALRYKCNLGVLDIADKLGVSNVTIYNWINNPNLLKEEYYDLIKEIIYKNNFNFDNCVIETKEISEEIKKIKNEDWRDLILGLQERLNFEQLQLLNEAGLTKDFHVSDWINGKRIPSDYKKFKLIEMIRRLKFQSSDLVNFGKETRQSIKFNNKWIPTHNALSLKDFHEEALININEHTFLNTICLFPNYRGKNPIKCITQGDKIIIFYDEKRSTRPEPMILQRHIEINNDFLVGLGIYIGEGSRNRKPKVTNSEPTIINQAINFYKIFGIEVPKLKAWIQLHERSNRNLNEVRNFWLENTLLKSDNLIKIRMKKSSGNSSIKEYGVLHLEANFILLQFLFNKLIDSVPVILYDLPKEMCISFLHGVFAAEGSVSLARSGSLRDVRYTSKRDDERLLIKNLLEKLDIEVHEYKKGFDLRVHGFENLRKLYEINIFKYHPLRDEKLKKGFINLSRNIIKR